MAQNGGKRLGAGRKKGSRNKVTKDVRELAQKYGPDAVKEIARSATNAESESARVAAIRELLDRAYGKAPQAIVGDPEQPIQHRVAISWMTKELAEERGWA